MTPPTRDQNEHRPNPTFLVKKQNKMEFNNKRMYIIIMSRVVVKWISCRTVYQMTRGSSPTTALISSGKTLIYISHYPQNC